jgi:hypothetical protein
MDSYDSSWWWLASFFFFFSFLIVKREIVLFIYLFFFPFFFLLLSSSSFFCGLFYGLLLVFLVSFLLCFRPQFIVLNTQENKIQQLIRKYFFYSFTCEWDPKNSKDAGKITNKIGRKEDTGNLNVIKHVFVNWLMLMVC